MGKGIGCVGVAGPASEVRAGVNVEIEKACALRSRNYLVTKNSLMPGRACPT